MPDPEQRLAWLVQDVLKKTGRRQRKFSVWKTAGFWLRGVAAVLTAIAGLTIMGEWLSTDAAGALAVASAIVTALVATYDPASRTVRVAVERAEWMRLLGQLQDLAWRRKQGSAQAPFSSGELAELTSLWDRYCTLLHEDAIARSTR